ncbi:molybdopterin molybdenumtransferase MoeA, partial [Hansschlegelia beijingensis]
MTADVRFLGDGGSLLAGDICGDPDLLSAMSAQERAAALVAGPVEAETVHLARLRGRISAEDVVSPTPLPPFDHSAMDGYAVASLDLYHVVRGRLVAGASGEPETLRPGDAARI